MYKLEESDGKMLDIIRSKVYPVVTVYIIIYAFTCVYKELHESIINGRDINTIKKLCSQMPQAVKNLVYLSLLSR